ncbi:MULTISPECIES: SUKH-3 domain-containing protein [unclassified Streptomyces]|uniref:SUKH-3 domain-containing protein n=1 Tax=unclassified Streptomyces TaxID=2593676 RepID=UPI0033B00AD1
MAWLISNGWAPGRDLGDRAAELVEIRVRDAERQGVALSPSPAATRVVHTYGLLRLPHPKAAETWLMKPTIGYEGDAALIQELAAGIGVGGYFLGADEYDAFSRFLSGVDAPDVEDWSV